MSRPLATVNVDVDPVDLHLVGYGHHNLAPDPLVYSRALPRIAGLLAKAGVRATFFVVGRNAAGQATALRALAEAGHEIASHSQSHPMALSRMAPAELREELVASKRDIGRAAGVEVQGFRAPNFDVDIRVLRALREAGYLYDASGYPTPWLIPARLLLALKSGDPGSVLRLRLWPFTFSGGGGGGWVFDNTGKRIKQFKGTGGKDHQANFIQAVRSRKAGDLAADIEKGHLSSALCHLGNISFRLGQKSAPAEIRDAVQSNKNMLEAFDRFEAHLKANEVDLAKNLAALGPALSMDPAAERFVGEHSDWANMFVRREYREPFVIRDQV